MMMKTVLKSALLATCFAVAACGPSNRGVESVNQPVVQRADYVIDVASSGEGLAPGEAQRVSDWFQSIKLAYGDRVSVDNPNPYGGNDASRSVAALAARHGLLLSDGAPVTAGEIPSGSVRVIVSRMKASVPNCPNFERAASPVPDNSTSSNFGCATNSNLAAMVADPRDLIEGREGTGVSSVLPSNNAIDGYRNKVGKSAGMVKSEGTN